MKRNKIEIKKRVGIRMEMKWNDHILYGNEWNVYSTFSFRLVYQNNVEIERKKVIKINNYINFLKIINISNN